MGRITGMPLRIGIDARLAGYRRGMGNYVHNLLWEFARLPTEHRFVLYVDDASTLADLPHSDRFTVRWLRPKLSPVWEQLVLPAHVARDGLDVFHSPANTAPLCLHSKTRLVVTIHDVMYMLPPDQVPLPRTLYQKLGRHYRRCVVPRAANKATRILSVSAYSKQDIERHLPTHSEQISVVHESPSPRFQRLSEEKRCKLCAAMQGCVTFDRPIIMHLGASDPRKNTSRVIEAFAAMKNRATDRRQLVVAGLSPAAIDSFSYLAARLGILDDICLLGFVAEEELVLLYNLAQVVVYPSLYEGFGLPVLEAMACGTPVITSNVCSIPEVAGDAAILINPNDTEALVRALTQLADDEALRCELIMRGKLQVSKFSWRRAAEETLTVYEEAAQQ